VKKKGNTREKRGGGKEVGKGFQRDHRGRIKGKTGESERKATKEGLKNIEKEKIRTWGIRGNIKKEGRGWGNKGLGRDHTMNKVIYEEDQILGEAKRAIWPCIQRREGTTLCGGKAQS